MKIKRSVLILSIVGLFLAFLFILVPRAQVVNAATVSPPDTTQTAASASSSGGTTTTSSTTTNQAPPVTVATSPTVTNPTTTKVAAPTQPQEPATTNSVKKEIPISGLTGSDAKVTDMKGNPVNPSNGLFTWDNFHVDYNWTIPDGVKINDGDTAEFELPSGLISSGNLSFPIYDSNNVEIGTASIKDGATTGTITFNNALSNTNANRKGTLTFVSKGSSTGNGSEGTNWNFNKIGWVSGYDANGLPDEVTWNVAFNPNLHELNNVVITDVLGKNQEYIPGSLTANAGHYVNGSFVNDAGRLNPTVTTEGNNVIISFPGKVTTAVDIYYRVKLTDTTNGTNVWSNHATMGSSEGEYTANADTSWGGSGTGNGDEHIGSVSLTKTDATTGSALEGAIYQLTDSNGTVIADNVRTDDKGVLTINDLPYGDYVLTEVAAPDGYELNTTPIKFSIPTNDSKVIDLKQTDTGKLGAVVLKKLDPTTNASISGTTFNLLDKAGNVVQAGLVTDLNGEISVSDLPAGEYSFVETNPAAGYVANSTPINFVVVAGETTPVTLDKFNVPEDTTPRTGTVVLTKYESGTTNFLPDAVYDLLDSNGDYVSEGLVTDEKGQISIPNLPVGNYTFVEVTAPVGYETSMIPINFTVTADQTVSVSGKDFKEDLTEEPPEETEDPSAVGRVVLKKLDAQTKTPLVGALFDLLDANGKVIRRDIPTDYKGRIFIDGMKPGKYSFVEVAPTTGYAPDSTPIEFEIIAGEETPIVLVKNNSKESEVAKTGSVTLTKYDIETDAVLPGAVYSLYSADGTLLDSNLVTDEKGLINISGLEPGDYYLVETSTPAGYDINTKKMKFTVVAGENAQIKAFDFREPDLPDDTPGSVILTKADSVTKNPLSGANFNLLDANGELVSEDLTTNEDGVISVDNLAPGKYSFVEVSPAAGYTLDPTPITFEIIAGEESSVTLKKFDTKENEVPKTGSVTLTKSDVETGEVLPGAVYELHSADGTLIESNLVTDEKGLISISGLEAGDYYLVETSAPAGYDINTEKMPFTVVAGENAQIKGNDHKEPELPPEEPNEEEPGSVILTKVDPDTGKALSGAIFELKDSTGKVIADNLVTNDKGVISIDNLAPGKYSFVETKPAAGYVLNESPINFEILPGQTAAVVLDKFNVAETVETHSGNVVLTKYDATLKDVLPGAVFDLLDSDGKVIQSNLVTDQKGQISIDNLEAGDYSFVETKAPEGYELNTTPIKFTIVADQTGNVSANDEPTKPEEPEKPENPEEPGTTVPPVKPEEPENPGTTTPPVKPEEPEEPGTTVPPVKPEEPENPGTTVPPVKPEEPEKPGTTVPPVKPEEPEKPGTTVPPVKPVEPEVPSVTNPSEPSVPTPSEPSVTVPSTPGAITPAPSPDEVLPSGNVSGSGTSSSDTGKFPQTGDASGLLLSLSGFFLALFVLFKHMVKKLS